MQTHIHLLPHILSLACRCGECCGGEPGPRGDQTLPGFPDAQQNLDPSLVPSAGLHQQRKQGRAGEDETKPQQTLTEKLEIHSHKLRTL